jgi:hypothetical protein
MTHPIYSQVNLESLSHADLKIISNQLGVSPDGDKRKKQSWVDAILAYQARFSATRIDPVEKLELEEPEVERIGNPTVTNNNSSDTSANARKLNASIVAIIAIVACYALFVIPIGLGIIVYRSVWGSLLLHLEDLIHPRPIDRIDYFPFPT